MCFHGNRNSSLTGSAHVVTILTALTTIGKWTNPPPFPYQSSYQINSMPPLLRPAKRQITPSTSSLHYTPLHSHTSLLAHHHYTTHPFTHTRLRTAWVLWHTPSRLHPPPSRHTPSLYFKAWITEIERYMYALFVSCHSNQNKMSKVKSLTRGSPRLCISIELLFSKHHSTRLESLPLRSPLFQPLK